MPARVRILLLILPLLSATPDPAEGRPPNIILILADDLGHGDLGVTGSRQIPTPHIDSLAAEGIHFTSAYVASPVCAPSRAGLMTGRCPFRFGFQENLAPVQAGHDPEAVGLPVSERTLADRLKHLGYATGIIGKWHLGERPQFHPAKRGFDEFWGWLGGAHDYFRAGPGGETAMAGPILCNFKEPAPLTYLTDDQGGECVDFIRRHASKPFFLFASFAAPHSPMQATAGDLAKFKDIEDGLRRTYCAMVHRLDQNVGRILDELEAQNLERDTLVVFLSDNGGPAATGMGNGSINAPFRAGKTTVLEGGIRVPMLMRWPAGLPAGVRMDAMVSSLDLVPTLVGAAGGGIGLDERLDGVDLRPFLGKAPATVPHRSLKWRYTVGSAMREGDWKLVTLPDRLPMLFQLSTDPAEQRDMAAGEPGRTRDMLRELGQWWVRSPNPLFREPADWRIRHLRFYDSESKLTQPE